MSYEDDSELETFEHLISRMGFVEVTSEGASSFYKKPQEMA